MARKPECRYWDSRNGYWCKIHGKAELLAAGPKDEPDGPTYLAALARYRELLSGYARPGAGDTRFACLAERYCQELELNDQAALLESSRYLLTSAVVRLGPVAAETIEPYMVREWLNDMKDWGSTTRNMAYRRFRRVLRWAMSEGYIKRHNFASVKEASFGKGAVRSEAYILEPELQELILRAAVGPFHDYCLALQQTGARPGEIGYAEPRHYRPDIRAIVFKWNDPEGYTWKNARKTEKDRVIFLPARLDDVIKRHLARPRGGWLFGGMKGGCLGEKNSRGNTWRAVLRKPAVAEWLGDHNRDPRTVIPYGFRHSKITDMLKAGISIKILADLMGTSAVMIERHYGHLHSDLTTMRDWFDRYSGGLK